MKGRKAPVEPCGPSPPERAQDGKVLVKMARGEKVIDYGVTGTIDYKVDGKKNNDTFTVLYSMENDKWGLASSKYLKPPM